MRYLLQGGVEYGTENRKHIMFVLHKTDEEAPISGKIRHVLTHRDNITLLCEQWHTIDFDRHYAYIVQPPEGHDILLTQVDNLFDFYPLQVVQSYRDDCQRFYITLRHNVGQMLGKDVFVCNTGNWKLPPVNRLT